jgi:TM2 domain-containing membrane protein YozV
MKHLVLVFVLALCVFSAKQVSASSYSVNEKSVDRLFDKAIETSMLSATSTDLSTGISGFPSTAMAGQQKDAVVAIVLDFFLGGLGIHRFYLGTELLTGLGYILTCGGIFGIVPLIDFVVLIINNKDIGPYVNNPKFFMWN